MKFERIGNKSASHLYCIEVELNGQRGEVEVDANNRAQASAIAEKAGYEVRSVNMVG